MSGKVCTVISWFWCWNNEGGGLTQIISTGPRELYDCNDSRQIAWKMTIH